MNESHLLISLGDKSACILQTDLRGTLIIEGQRICKVNTDNYNPVKDLTTSEYENYFQFISKNYGASIVQFVAKVKEKIQKQIIYSILFEGVL